MNDCSVVIMYGASPCHAGSGSSMGVVDLPIQRERHTNWPVIQASGVKGAFRANFERYKNVIKEGDKEQVADFEKLTDSIFGTSDGNGYAGSLSISDAKILAYPMRSNVNPFVWISCPAVLKRFARDLSFAGKIDNAAALEADIARLNIKENNAVCAAGSISGKVLLEDHELSVATTQVPDSIKTLAASYLKDADKLLVVSDDVFDYGVTDCTQVMAQIKIDSKTGTTETGSLRYQEELPSDTIMYALVVWGDSKNSAEEKLKAETIKRFVSEQVIAKYIQIAGDETCGRGIFELTWN